MKNIKWKTNENYNTQQNGDIWLESFWTYKTDTYLKTFYFYQNSISSWDYKLLKRERGLKVFPKTLAKITFENSAALKASFTLTLSNPLSPKLICELTRYVAKAKRQMMEVAIDVSPTTFRISETSSEPKKSLWQGAPQFSTTTLSTFPALSTFLTLSTFPTLTSLSTPTKVMQ